MKILKKRNKRIYFIFLFLLFLIFCKKERIIEIRDPLGDWTKYIDCNLENLTKISDNIIRPKIILKLKKICKEELYSFKYKFSYIYGYDYYTKVENVEISYGTEDIKRMNKGEVIEKEYSYEDVRKIKIPTLGYDYDIYNAPDMIMYGLKINFIVTEIKIIKK